jgi:DNA-directed RNA polymerase specialized sigma24 family protein
MLQPEVEEIAFEAVIDARALRVMLSAAQYHSGRIARTLNLDETARDDAEQEILLIILSRRHYYDPARGAWTTFVNRIARQAAQIVADDIAARRRTDVSLDAPETSGICAELKDTASLTADEIYYVVALQRYLMRLPAELRVVALHSFYADGDLAEAQRELGLSTSEFYRRIRELRYRFATLRFVAKRSIL